MTSLDVGGRWTRRERVKKVWSAERKAAWVGRRRKKNSKPDSEILAQGSGWGADPRLKRATYLTYDRVLDKKAAADRALAVIGELMETAEHPQAMLNASGALLDRIEGQSVKRTIDTPNGETLEELRVIDSSKLTPEQREVLRE